jgi:hypothetical protein
MTGLRPFAIAVALAALAAPLVGAPKPANVSAKVTFADSVGTATARVRSDGGTLAAYFDGLECVQTWYALPKGNFFLRNVTSNSPCDEPNPPRRLVLDFSDRSWPSGPCVGPLVADRYLNLLDPCGVNSVDDARLVADKLFSANATALNIPFSLQPDFRYTAFELTFVGTLGVAQAGSGRTMTADWNAIAELWQINGRSKTLLGRYRMPLQVTVTAKPD